MSDRRRDCELLRPVLVALVYDEPHPELPRLMAHLEVCECCREEEDDLSATRAWVDDSADRLAVDLETVHDHGKFRRGSGVDARRTLLSGISNVLAGAAVAGLVFWLLLAGGEDGTDGESGALSEGQGEPASAAAALSFDGVELDRRLEWLDGEVGLLTDSGEDPW